MRAQAHRGLVGQVQSSVSWSWLGLVPRYIFCWSRWFALFFDRCYDLLSGNHCRSPTFHFHAVGPEDDFRVDGEDFRHAAGLEDDFRVDGEDFRHGVNDSRREVHG